MAPATFTKTETLRRIRALGAEIRGYAGAPANAPLEIGHRNLPQTTQLAPTSRAQARELCYPDGDDLNDHEAVNNRISPQAHGAVLHIQTSAPIGFGEWELADIVCVWLGTPDHEPRVIDPRFVPGEIRATRLQPGDRIETKDGSVLTVERVLPPSVDSDGREYIAVVYAGGSVNHLAPHTCLRRAY